MHLTMDIEIETTRFGRLTADEEALLTFPDGLPGFAGARRFVPVPHGDDSPFVWLQSAERPELAFLLLSPGGAFPDYAPPLPADTAPDAALWVIVTVPPGDARAMTANLLGPLVIEGQARRGRQIILDGDRYSTKHRVLPAGASSAGAAAGAGR
uniref:Flagellar assembly factor FliW n=1 Tax=uncultured Armatimonadetes bacterium TaxID=157466 RepID=A0A6J4HY61_9BACT|nr:hypothetical protein AVDCRST_MAG63-1386 [uncultured Armatimonadetes bacterium]